MRIGLFFDGNVKPSLVTVKELTFLQYQYKPYRRKSSGLKRHAFIPETFGQKADDLVHVLGNIFTKEID